MKTKIAPQKPKQALNKTVLCETVVHLEPYFDNLRLEKNPTVRLHVSLNSFFSELWSAPFPASSLFDQEHASVQDAQQHKGVLSLFM